MSIWTWASTRLGWKTHGPASIDGPGGFDTPSEGNLYPALTQAAALNLSVVWACMTLRAETIGALPIQVRDKDKNILTEHPLYDVVRHSPNAMQTAPEFFSMATANVDMHGNALAIVQRRSDKSVISLEPVDGVTASARQRRSGRWWYKFGEDEYPAEDVLHFSGFSMDGIWGLSRLDVGRKILSGQVQANDAAIRGFLNSLKTGGFFEVAENLDKPALKEFRARLDYFGLPENRGKWMTLLRGMKPVGGSQFNIKPGEAELLASRGFGIEEGCRLFNTPPQLVGHTDKASSWASSIENINLFFLTYSLTPSLVRKEARMNKTLLSPADRAKGIHVKFNVRALQRGDIKTQTAMLNSQLQNGVVNRNEVRDTLDLPGIGPEGDEYMVQMNMAQQGDKLPDEPGGGKV